MSWNEVLNSLVDWVFIVLILRWFVHKNKWIWWVIRRFIFFLGFRIYLESDWLHINQHLRFITTWGVASKTRVNSILTVYFFQRVSTVSITFIIFLWQQFAFFIFLFFIFLLILLITLTDLIRITILKLIWIRKITTTKVLLWRVLELRYVSYRPIDNWLITLVH